MQLQIPIIYCQGIVSTVCRSAADRKRVLEGTGIESGDLDQLAAGVTLQGYRTLLRNAVAISGRESVILDAGVAMPLSAHGILGTAAICCPNRLQALELFVRFIKLRGFFASARIQSEGEWSHLSIELDGALQDDKERALDFMLGAIYTALSMSGVTPLPRYQIQLTRSRSEHHHYYQRVLQADISYRHDADRLVFERSELQLPQASYDEEQYRMAVRRCQLLLVDTLPAASFKQAVEHLFEMSPGVIWTLKQVAAELNICPRTLQRRLAAEGLGYQQVLDGWLSQLAVQYIRAEGLSVYSAAMLLGYTDESNFRRAFKRWHGCSPHAYRQRNAGLELH